MKLSAFTSKDPELSKLSSQLRRVLSAISKDNMTTQEITGKTSSSVDTEQKFRHSLSASPSLWFPIAGDIYIPKGGIGASQIDVRSSKIDEEFTVLLVK